MPLEWVGLTVPWTAERLAEIDRRLNLDEFLSVGAVARMDRARSGSFSGAGPVPHYVPRHALPADGDEPREVVDAAP